MLRHTIFSLWLEEPEFKSRPFDGKKDLWDLLLHKVTVKVETFGEYKEQRTTSRSFGYYHPV